MDDFWALFLLSVNIYNNTRLDSAFKIANYFYVIYNIVMILGIPLNTVAKVSPNKPWLLVFFVVVDNSKTSLVLSLPIMRD